MRAAIIGPTSLYLIFKILLSNVITPRWSQSHYDNYMAEASFTKHIFVKMSSVIFTCRIPECCIKWF